MVTHHLICGCQVLNCDHMRLEHAQTQCKAFSQKKLAPSLTRLVDRRYIRMATASSALPNRTTGGPTAHAIKDKEYLDIWDRV
jgi:hypothetical protein